MVFEAEAGSTFTPTANTAIVPVTLQVTAGSVSLNPQSLSFTQAWGGPAPVAQNLAVAGSGPPLTYTATSRAIGSGSWLGVSPSNSAGVTTSNLSVSADGSSLPVGTYQGVITVTAFGPGGTPVASSPAIVNVTLTVTPGMVAAPASLSFTQVRGAAAPPAQTVQLTSNPATVPFTLSMETNAGGAWLQVTPGSGTVPATLHVSTNAGNLAEGTYSGMVRVTPGSNAIPATVTVRLTVLPAPQKPAVLAIQNAASYATVAISPGENLVISGTGIGPAILVGPQLTRTGLATTVSDTEILFGNTPAPIIYASATQTSVMVPYEIAGQSSVAIRASYKGVPSDAVTFAIADSVPGIYTQNLTGGGPGLIVNQDGVTINNSSAPAAPDSVVTVYLTGEGVTNPASVTGGIAPTDGSGLNHPILPVSATVGGMPAEVLYAGSAPGIVYGVMQVNIRVPASASSGAQPVLIMVGNAITQQGVTLAVR